MTKIVNKDNLDEAASCLSNGGTVIFPPETVYGLGADALNEEAVKKIYAAKGRPSDNPLIVHIADTSRLDELVSEISDEAKKLIDTFWPGPLTVIFKKSNAVPSIVTAGLDTVAVRFPSDKTAQELIKKSGVFVAAPSANLSGSPSPTVFRHVFDDMDGRVDYIIDGGECNVGIESTVLDVSGDEFKILRPGYITFEDIKSVTDKIKNDYVDIKGVETPKCPGMKYTHYSPKADVYVVMGNAENCKKYIDEVLEKRDCKIGVLSYKNTPYPNCDYTINAGFDMTQYAYLLYEALREFDEQGMDVIYAQLEDEGGVGVAVKNRIFKSAGYKIIKV